MYLSIKTKNKVLALMLTIVALMAGQTAMAQGMYTATDGSEGANDSEGYENLLDGDTGTKWCVTGFDPSKGAIFVEFETSSPIIPVGYTLTTGNDTEGNPGRNPSNWKILAKNDGDTGWTTLVEVEDDNTLGAENFESYDFTITNTEEYQYFRFEISHLQNDNGGVFQLSEFSFKLQKNVKDLYQATVAGLQAEYYYTGTAINIGSFSVKDADDNTIDPSNYTYTIKDAEGNDVTNVIKPGKYQLIISPSNTEYINKAYFTFEVLPWGECLEAGYCGDANQNLGKNLIYTITNEDGVKTLTIKKNPYSPEGSDFSMESYNYDEDWESSIFAPWIKATPNYNNYDNDTPDDDSDDYQEFDVYDLSCDIEKVVIEEGVTNIGSGAFYDCTKLSSVSAPSTIEYIGEEAFTSTIWIDNLPNGITYVGKVAYQRRGSDEQFVNVEFKEGTVSIQENLFYICDNLETVVIPASVKNIGAYAFQACSNLKTVTIGAGVTYIGYDAFFNCEKVTDVYCHANPENLTWDESACDDFKRGETKTKCHVADESEWSSFVGDVNVEFVGDLTTPTTKKEDGKYWATFYNGTKGNKIVDNENACAYTATIENSTLTLHKLGKVIPAATAVIIVSDDANFNMLTVDGEATAEYTVSNDLKGVDVSTPLASLGEGTFYVLGKQDDNFGFYKYGGTNMPAHKAYLQVTGTSSVRGFNMEFDGETTEIRTTNYTNYTNSDAIYDLQGRKVANPTKGLYILNGKKIVVK
jgi:hypothetical protein